MPFQYSGQRQTVNQHQQRQQGAQEYKQHAYTIDRCMVAEGAKQGGELGELPTGRLQFETSVQVAGQNEFQHCTGYGYAQTAPVRLLRQYQRHDSDGCELQQGQQGKDRLQRPVNFGVLHQMISTKAPAFASIG